ncbi:MAG TPA: metallophosphoesterase [Candidatus Korarchaeota archaeon]|nr:metallophosphoesterase [Candidatus Korarchaeota archaeon]
MVHEFEVRVGKLMFFPYGTFHADLGALIVADLHIGYEEVLFESGIHLPKSQYGKIKSMIISAVERYDPEVLILLGDVKHEFGSSTRQEWVEVLDLLRSLRDLVKIHVVRGNHDNFLIPILRREDVPLHDPSLRLGELVLFHGHKPLPDVKDAELVVMGHEHPAVALRDELGVKRKFKCALLGELAEFSLVVLPAASPLAPGTDMLATPAEDLLSPVLSSVNLENFEVIITDEEAGSMRFGTLGALRKVQGISLPE